MFGWLKRNREARRVGVVRLTVGDVHVETHWFDGAIGKEQLTEIERSFVDRMLRRA